MLCVQDIYTNSKQYFVVFFRLCRQYLECLSFSVEWEDDDFGICSIYDGILSKLDLLYALSTTMYSK